MRLVMLATGPFAVPTLRALADSEHEIATVVTRPPRGRRAEPSPVAKAAEEMGLPLWMPDTVNEDDAREKLRGYDADLLVVCDYGEILKPETLATTAQGGINLHGSLLPKYRGAAPVQWAILRGEEETGNTVIQMTPRLDAGPALAVQRISIDPDETAGALEERMAEQGAALVLEVLAALESGTAAPLVQDNSEATKAPRLKKEHGQIDWSRSALEIKNQARALQPWPRAYTSWQGSAAEPLRLIIHRVALAEGENAEAGTVIKTDGQLIIACGIGSVRLEEVQPAGKRKMTAEEFLRGYAVKVGERLG